MIEKNGRSLFYNVLMSAILPKVLRSEIHAVTCFVFITYLLLTNNAATKAQLTIKF